MWLRAELEWLTSKVAGGLRLRLQLHEVTELGKARQGRQGRQGSRAVVGKNRVGGRSCINVRVVCIFIHAALHCRFPVAVAAVSCNFG